MATINNNPGNSNDSDSSFNMILGTVAILVVIVLAYFYVLPAMGVDTFSQKDMSINVPAPQVTPMKSPDIIPMPTPAPTQSPSTLPSPTPSMP